MPLKLKDPSLFPSMERSAGQKGKIVFEERHYFDRLGATSISEERSLSAPRRSSFGAPLLDKDFQRTPVKSLAKSWGILEPVSGDLSLENGYADLWKNRNANSSRILHRSVFLLFRRCVFPIFHGPRPRSSWKRCFLLTCLPSPQAVKMKEVLLAPFSKRSFDVSRQIARSSNVIFTI